jgi:AcrR family transcriptional regulator
VADVKRGGGERGPREDRGVLSARILAAARKSFAEHGWAGTTMRGVAREAGVDPALVPYYFKDKRGLLAASLQLPESFTEGVAAAQVAPGKRRGRAFVDTMLGLWEDPATGEILHSIFLTAAHEPLAMERLRETFSASVLAVVSESLEGPERYLRASLVASQIIGVAMTRYVWRIGALSELSPEEVARYVAPTVQRYLSGKL